MKRISLLTVILLVVTVGAVFGGGSRENGEITQTSEPQYGGTLVMKVAFAVQGPKGWDPVENGGNDAASWTSPYLERLVIADIDTFGPRGTNIYDFTAWETVPNEYLTGQLAESWEIVTEPDVRVTFHLRKGVMWTGNERIGMAPREFVADDVVFHMNRVLRYLESINDNSMDWIDAVRAADRYTVVVEANRFYADWLAQLGYSRVMPVIIPQEVVEAGASDWRNHTGTGPFIITDYVEGTGATYIKNPNYWGTTKIDGKTYNLPFVDELVLPVIPDVSTEISALRSGQIDWKIAVPPEYSESLSRTSPDLIQNKYFKSSINVLFFNTANKPWDNRDIRRALMMAIDYDAITEAIYPVGGGIHAWPVDFRSPAHTPFEELPAEVRELYEYNPDKAREMITNAGYPNGFDITIVTPTRDYQAEYQDFVEMVADMWADIGVNARIQVMETAARNSLLREHTYEDLFGWRLVTTDALNGMRHGTSYLGSKMWSDPYFDSEYEIARNTIDEHERNWQLRKLAVYYLQEAPAIPGVHQALINAYWPWVRNYYGELESGYYNYSQMVSRIWIDQAMKKSMGF